MKRKKGIIGILLVIEVICIFLMYKSKPTNYVELENVGIQKLNKNMFAMYVKEDGEYVKRDQDTFPEGYILNVANSRCVDINGDEIKDALVAKKDGSVTLKTNKTVYCYLYFDERVIDDVLTGLKLIISISGTNGLSETLQGGMYRYQGNEGEVKNYVCFGTDNPKDDCASTDSNYIYRIIGIMPDGQIKLVKSNYSSAQKWNDSSEVVLWQNSSLYKYLNDSENPLELNDKWLNLISNHKWMEGSIGDFYGEYGVDGDGISIYEIETGQKKTDVNGKKESLKYWDSSVEAKYGLMYVHDVVLGASNNSDCYYERCPSWINDLGSFWTMTTLYGTSSGADYQFAFNGGPSGGVGISSMKANEEAAVKPVFYLKSGVQLTGSGTKEDPYVVLDSKPLGESLIESLRSQGSTLTGLSEEMIGGMYRFQGKTNTLSNFACFGETSGGSLSSTSSGCGYRIIGITGDGEFKILGGVSTDARSWGPGTVSWPETELFAMLNEKRKSVFGDEKWYDLIEDYDWMYGTIGTSGTTCESKFSSGTNGENLYEIETGQRLGCYGADLRYWDKSVNSKIGSLYLHDVKLTVASGDTYGWISSTEYLNLWMITLARTFDVPSSFYQSGYIISGTSTTLKIDTKSLSESYRMKPVFYVKSGVNVTGTGVYSDPFVVHAE